MTNETKSAPATKPASDWRINYVICEHVAADEKQGVRHSGFRVCCESCWKDGFLTAEPFEHVERADGLCVGQNPAASPDTRAIDGKRIRHRANGRW